MKFQFGPIDFDDQWSWDEYREELSKPSNIPIIGPYFSIAKGDFIPRYSEESLGAMATIGLTTFLLGVSTRLAVASMLAAPIVTQPAIVAGSAVTAVRAETAMLEHIVADDDLSNVEKAVTLGTYTNVPYW